MFVSQYCDKDLVALYDILNSGSDDHLFYLQIPVTKPLRILDVGCGTGVLAVEFAKAKHMVTGVDPASAMIEFARNREGGGSVEWVCSSITDFDHRSRFDLITMTGHAFQCLHEDAEVLQLFRAVHRLLAEDGKFVFETRNPASSAWLKWNPRDSLIKSVTATGGLLETFHEVTSVSDNYVEFHTTYNLVDNQDIKVCHSKLRFIGLKDLTKLAVAADLTVCEVFGNWDKSLLTDGSPEIICSLQKNH